MARMWAYIAAQQSYLVPIAHTHMLPQLPYHTQLCVHMYMQLHTPSLYCNNALAVMIVHVHKKLCMVKTTTTRIYYPDKKKIIHKAVK